MALGPARHDCLLQTAAAAANVDPVAQVAVEVDGGAAARPKAAGPPPP